MKIIKLQQTSPEWKSLRLGKITGSKLKDIVTLKGNSTKIGVYELVADKLSAGEDEDESPMQRGIRLEPEAVEVFQEMTGFEVERDIGLCISDENENVAYSPDGVIIKDFKITEDIEIKCLSSAKHIEAFFTQQIPSDYYAQMIQGFIVNPDLQKRYMVFYDPRIMCKPMHWIEMKREDVEVDIKFYYEYQVEVLKKVDEMVEKLSF